MASFLTTTADTAAQTLAAGEIGTVTAAGSLSSASLSTMVSVTGDGTALFNAGYISGASNGVVYGLSAFTGTIVNTGVISGDAFGINLAATTAALSVQITNSGLIAGTGLNGDGIRSASGGVIINNSGQILSQLDNCIQLQAGAVAASNIIINTGIIASGAPSVWAIFGGDDVENVYNSGRVVGDVVLGAGDDLYDGRGGILRGQVQGGAGDDTFYIDDAAIELIEAAGEGDLDRVYASVSYELPDNIELLTLLGAAGTGQGNDLGNSLVGNARANNLIGLAGDDLLEGRRGTDVLRGGSGADTLIGGGEADLLRGGAGADVFRFTAIGDSDPSERDTIADFARGADKIDLSTLDARPDLANDQAFVFRGTRAFSGLGQARIIDLGAKVMVELNLTGDRRADMSFLVLAPGALSGGDFLL